MKTEDKPKRTSKKAKVTDTESVMTEDKPKKTSKKAKVADKQSVMTEDKPKKTSKKAKVADTESIKKDPLTIKIEDWHKKMNVKEYVINADKTIDAWGCVDLRGMLDGDLPDYIQFSTIHADKMCKLARFNIANNPIKSLRGCPHTVDGCFECYNTKVKSLEYFPKKVSMQVNFHSNGAEFDEAEIEGICEYEFIKTWAGNRIDSSLIERKTSKIDKKLNKAKKTEKNKKNVTE